VCFLFIFRVDFWTVFIYFCLPRGFVVLIQVTFCKYLLFVKTLRNMIFQNAHSEISLLKVHVPLLKLKFLTLAWMVSWTDHSLEPNKGLLKRTPEWSHHKVLYIIVIILHHYLSYLLKARTNF
jgi:hypothetical protein